MKAHQEVKMPKLHGDSPQNLAMAIRTPRGPVVQKKFKSLKDAMAYLKEKNYAEYDED